MLNSFIGYIKIAIIAHICLNNGDVAAYGVGVQSPALAAAAVIDGVCLNPNGHPGECISIDDCASLSDVLRKKISASYRFVRLSHCDSGEHGKYLPVCCTAETQFTNSIDAGNRGNSESRIHYPDRIKTPYNHRIHNIVYPQQDYGQKQQAEMAHPRETKIIFPHEEITDEQASSSSPMVASSPPPETTPAVVTTSSDSNSLVQHNEKKEFLKFPTLRHCGSLTISNKIFGGEAAELTEFSWMVNLEYTTPEGGLVSGCAGSLINERYVLTVGHCVKGPIEIKKGKITYARVGDHNTITEIDCDDHRCLPPYIRVGIEHTVVHENFGNDDAMNIHQHNDIALIRLIKTVKFTDAIQPVCLPTVEPITPLVDGMKLWVAGWGHTGNHRSSPVKLKVHLPIVNHDVCRKTHLKNFFVADEQLCAGGVYRQDSCTGDSGGPLMRLSSGHWILEGLVSFGHGCGLENSPGVYTNIRYYLDWIDSNVQPW